jgi:hypothetical protein
MLFLGIHQFFTCEEILEQSDNAPLHPHFGNFDRPRDTRQAYFEALEQLRDHLSRCLAQIATIAGMQTPTDGLIANYRGPWSVEAYLPPPNL